MLHYFLMKRFSETHEQLPFHAGLGPSQSIAFAKAINGDSLFITGSAGTGKSELLKRIIGYWAFNRRNFAVTATTGLAAVALKGRTLHSFFWLRPQDDDDEVTAEMIYQRLLEKSTTFSWYRKTMRSLSSLIVDEISMLSVGLFTKLSSLLKLVRQNSKPFGGLQLIFVGDFYQLPPVKGRFLFESTHFRECFKDRVELKECYRQSDPTFVALLGRMRTGNCTPEDLQVLHSRVGVNIECHGIMPTELFATNKDVDELNNDRLSQINTSPMQYHRVVGTRSTIKMNDSSKLEKFLKDLNLPECVILKAPDYIKYSDAEIAEIEDRIEDQINTHFEDRVIDVSSYSKDLEAVKNGAQVMLTFNLKQERGLVNGSRGVVIEFQVPSSSVHVHRSMLDDFDEHDPKQIKAYVKGLQHPLVRFIVDGNPVEILVPLVRYERRDKTLLTYAWVMPLKLAWATSVHKSQGQSLDFVKASIDSTVFADGQAYVAVSRARTLEGLSLKSFDPKAIKASGRVKQFYENDF